MTCKSARSTLSNAHLTQNERHQIQALRRIGYSLRKIARQLGRAPSTISRELQRAGATQDYEAAAAQALAVTAQRRVLLIWALRSSWLSALPSSAECA